MEIKSNKLKKRIKDFKEIRGLKTLYEIQTYLRNIHNIRLFIIESDVSMFEYNYYILYPGTSCKFLKFYAEQYNRTFTSFEDAMEIGLFDCLDLI